MNAESSAPPGAVFLSYASQDAEAARKICETLRAAGVEVWFDQSELVGGDAWDAKIRKQIRECVLFVPILSKTTQGRREAYFRLEWNLADERTHLMARGTPFLLPITIDETNDRDALVPDSFLAVQWTKAPGGELPPSFCARVKRLLSSETGGAALRRDETDPSPRKVAQPVVTREVRWMKPVLASAVLVAVVLAITLAIRPSREFHEEKLPAKTPPAPAAPEKLSPARELAERARNISRQPSLNRVQLDTAAELCERALQLDQTDALVWAIAADVELYYIFPYGYDTSDDRRRRVQERIARGASLDPTLFDVRVVRAKVNAHAVGTPALMAEAEKTLRELVTERPEDHRLPMELAEVLRDQRRYGEAAKLLESIGEFEIAAWSYFQGGELPAALAAVNRAPRSVTGLQLTAILEYCSNEDLARAEAAIDRLQPSELLAEMPATVAMRIAMYRRDPERMLEVAKGLSRDYLTAHGFHGPRAYYTGLANVMAGRPVQAEAEWRAALALVESMLKSTPDDRQLLLSSVWLHSVLGDRTSAEAIFARSQALAGLKGDTLDYVNYSVLLELRKKEALLTGAEDYFRAKRPLWQTMHAELRFSPEADFLRGDPRFEKLLRDYLPEGARPLDPPKATAAVAPDQKSVAVLAFANLSDDKANEYFSDGISEELLNVLAKVPGLKVSARTSAFYFKDRQVPLSEIAKQLGVAYVVEGSVRKSGDRVRITAQLIKAEDGFHVWSDTFTRELKDIFAVQDEIAGLISQNLQIKMDVVSPSPRRAVNPEAHRFVLEGRHYWNLRTADGFAKAESAFARAIELDPQFAQAHAGLADVIITKQIFESYDGSNGDLTKLPREEIRRALAIDPSLAEAYPASGAVLMWEGRFVEAEQEFKKAFALNPNYALAHHWYSLVLELQGRLDAALAEIDLAIQLDPLSVSALATRARFLNAAGDFAEALEANERVRTLRPDFGFVAGDRALSLLATGHRDEAVSLARLVEKDDTRDTRWMTDADALYVLRQTGHEAEATARVDSLLARFPPDSYLRGTVLAVMGRWDEAMPFLERTPIGLRSIYFWSPVWDAWRDDARFQQLIAKLGCEEAYKTARESRRRFSKEAGGRNSVG